MPYTRRSILAMLPMAFASRAFPASKPELSDLLKQHGRTAKRPLRLMLPDGSQANLRPIIEEFTRLSGVPVDTTITHVDDINTRLTEDALLGADLHDVALPATFGVPDLVRTRVLQPLDVFLDRWPSTYQRSGHLYTHGDMVNGSRYGFQTDGDVYLLFFRNDLLNDPEEGKRFEDTFGYELGRPSNWSHLDDMMRHFHRPEQDQYGGLLFRQPGYVGWEYIARLESEGLQLFGADMIPTFNTDEAAKVVEDMIRSGETQHPQSMTAGLFENWKAYKDNKIFANIGWGGSQKSFNRVGSPLQNNLSYAALPKGKGAGRGYFNWGWSYVLPVGSDCADLGYLFSALAVSHETSTRAVEQADGYFDPFHEAHYSSPRVQDVYGEAFLQEHAKAMRAAGPDLYIPGYGNYMAILNEHIHAALTGQLSVPAALERLQVAWETVTFELGRQEQLQFYARLG